MKVSYADFAQATVTYLDLMSEISEGELVSNLLSVCAGTRRHEMAVNGLSVLTEKQRTTHASRTDDRKAAEAQLSLEKVKVTNSYLKGQSSAVLDLLFNRALELDLLDDIARKVQNRDCISFRFSRLTGDLAVRGSTESVDLMTDSFVRIYIKSIANGIAYWGLDNDVRRINRLPGELLSKFYYIRRDGIAVPI